MSVSSSVPRNETALDNSLLRFLGRVRILRHLFSFILRRLTFDSRVSKNSNSRQVSGCTNLEPTSHSQQLELPECLLLAIQNRVLHSREPVESSLSKQPEIRCAFRFPGTFEIITGFTQKWTKHDV